MRWLAFLLVVIVSSGAHAAEIKTVRTSLDPARTRVVFDLTDRVEYKVFTMRNPHRVVIDFRQTRPRAKLTLPTSASKTLKRLRHAARGEQGLRVVLDLEHAVKVDDVLLAPNREYGYRVVLDLTALQPTGTLGVARNPELIAAAEVPHASKKAASTELAAVKRTPAPAVAMKTLRDVVVAIDAGHGGQDVGAIGPSGVYEKEITLAVARELAAVINQHPGMRAVLTRRQDRYLKLRERLGLAREHRADVFISVHADAFRDRRVQGSSVYVLSQSGASSEAAEWLADNENASDLIGGVSLDDKDDVLKSVLLDLSQTASIEASIDLGNSVLDALKRLGPVHKKRVQHAGFMVLKSPDIPSILVETAFISNPTEEKRLRNQKFRRKLAEALYGGVLDYFESNPPPDTRIAENRRHKVVRGDTLSGIASRYAVSINSLMLANSMASKMVRTGEVLTIP
jgi:N-acetylmuramoyl-L-alanine amidase